MVYHVISIEGLWIHDVSAPLIFFIHAQPNYYPFISLFLQAILRDNARSLFACTTTWSEGGNSCAFP